MTFLSTLPCAAIAFRAVLSFGLFMASYALAQTTDADQLALAREAIAKQDWRTAETLLAPLAQKQSQSQNPFVFYELAQVYENTRRPDAAKKIYQELTTSPDLVKHQPTIVIRAPYASRLLSLISLSQSKLNAIEAKQLAALPLSEPASLKPTALALPEVVMPKTIAASNPPTPALAAQPVPQQEVNAAVAVSTALKNWADAWARKDLSKYFSSYTESFRGQLPTPDSWKKQRQANILKPKSIQLDIKNVAMTTLSASSVQVQFQQTYTSDLFKEASNKTLMFAFRSGQWVIESETTK
jgi:hypothetical protein